MNSKVEIEALSESAKQLEREISKSFEKIDTAIKTSAKSIENSLDEIKDSIKGTSKSIESACSKITKAIESIDKKSEKTSENTDKSFKNVKNSVSETAKDVDKSCSNMKKSISSVDKQVEASSGSMDKSLISVKNTLSEVEKEFYGSGSKIEKAIGNSGKAVDGLALGLNGKLGQSLKKTGMNFKEVTGHMKNGASAALENATVFDRLAQAEDGASIASTLLSEGLNLVSNPMGWLIETGTSLLVKGLGEMIDSFNYTSTSIQSSETKARNFSESINLAVMRIGSLDTKLSQTKSSGLQQFQDGYMGLVTTLKMNQLELNEDGLRLNIDIEAMGADRSKLVEVAKTSISSYTSTLYGSLSDYYANSSMLTDEQEGQNLNSVLEYAALKLQGINDIQAKIMAIEKTAIDEKRQFTDEERSQLIEHYASLEAVATTALSDEEKQLKVHRELLKAHKGNLTKEELAELKTLEESALVEKENRLKQSMADQMIAVETMYDQQIELAAGDAEKIKQLEAEKAAAVGDIAKTGNEKLQQAKKDSINSMAELVSGGTMEEIAEYERKTAELAILNQDNLNGVKVALTEEQLERKKQLEADLENLNVKKDGYDKYQAYKKDLSKEDKALHTEMIQEANIAAAEQKKVNDSKIESEKEVAEAVKETQEQMADPTSTEQVIANQEAYAESSEVVKEASANMAEALATDFEAISASSDSTENVIGNQEEVAASMDTVQDASAIMAEEVNRKYAEMISAASTTSQVVDNQNEMADSMDTVQSKSALLAAELAHEYSLMNETANFDLAEENNDEMLMAQEALMLKSKELARIQEEEYQKANASANFDGAQSNVGDMLTTHDGLLNEMSLMSGKLDTNFTDARKKMSFQDAINEIKKIDLLSSGEKAANGYKDGFNNKFKGFSPSFSISAKSNVAGIPGISMFATGNVATRATLGIFGEYSTASIDPEITAPQSMMAKTFKDVLSSTRMDVRGLDQFDNKQVTLPQVEQALPMSNQYSNNQYGIFDMMQHVDKQSQPIIVENQVRLEIDGEQLESRLESIRKERQFRRGREF